MVFNLNFPLRILRKLPRYLTPGKKHSKWINGIVLAFSSAGSQLVSTTWTATFRGFTPFFRAQCGQYIFYILMQRSSKSTIFLRKGESFKDGFIVCKRSYSSCFILVDSRINLITRRFSSAVSRCWRK